MAAALQSFIVMATEYPKHQVKFEECIGRVVHTLMTRVNWREGGRGRTDQCYCVSVEYISKMYSLHVILPVLMECKILKFIIIVTCEEVCICM